MGWLFSEQSRNALIHERCAPWKNEHVESNVIKHSLRGNCLWKVIEHKLLPDGKVERFIALDLIQVHGREAGYKDMDESMGPYYYSCPLSYLELVPEVTNEEWRKGVRSYHARRNQKLELGQVVKLTNNESYKLVSLRPLKGVNGGVLYRIPRRMLLAPDVEQKIAGFVEVVNK